MKVHSREAERCNITPEVINSFFDKLTELLTQVKEFSLIINMDESGFSSRPLKNSTQNCCFVSNCTIPPTFKEEHDSSHISIVGAVSTDGKPLKPMLLSVNKTPPNNIKGTWLEDQFEWFQTPKGYMNHLAMISWIKTVLIPYVTLERIEHNAEDQPALLIMDGLKSHLMSEILDLLNENKIIILCLPPHSSHILQVLDLAIFSPMKNFYRNSKSQLFQGQERKMAKKVEKIIKAFYYATYKGNILSGWQESGLPLEFQNGKIVDASVNRAKVLSKLNIQ